KASDLVKVELLVEPNAIRPGDGFTAAVRLTSKPGWHTYWRNPGDSGLATEIAWTLPDGFAAGPILWPVPERIPVSHLVNYGYEGETILLTRITAPSSASPGGTASLAAQVSYLVCERECIPGEASLTATVPVARPGDPVAPDLVVRDAFESARAKLPSPSPWTWAASAGPGGAPVLTVAAPGLDAGSIRSAYFFPYDEVAIDHAAPQALSIGPDGLKLQFETSTVATGPVTKLDGVLVLEEALEGGVSRQAFALGEPPALATGSAASAGAKSAPASADLSLTAILQAAALAFLGGLVLNFMPCVFPVLSIKAMSLVKHSGLPPRLVRLNALAYGGGVVASFLALAGILLAARAAGAEIGWGYQLQSPVVVAALAFLMLGLGLSLSGVLEFGTTLAARSGGVAARDGLAGSALTGALAVAVATPCTAPFMGAATGYALLAPAPVALAVFAALGLGMALPFLLLTIAPGLASRLPRPGRWMEVVKQLLAFPLYATAAWLVFVLSRQVGPTGLLATLVGAVAVGFGAWSLRLAQGGGAAARWGGRGGALAATAALVALLGVVAGDRAGEPGGAGTALAATGRAGAAGAGESEPYTQARLDALLAQGRPVFVNLTAAWCITCAVNERVALASESVRQAMADRGIVYLKGDWTNRNPEITKLLERSGRSGVPLYLVYAGKGEPAILPQILTEGIVLDGLERIEATPTRRADLSPDRR
ncbi:MAG: thioredoxin family protein, partial [Methylobacteriaceae bacterium]|nr:thioredoxin family protein [Methylobacteriaceae bacterium]